MKVRMVRLISALPPTIHRKQCVCKTNKEKQKSIWERTKAYFILISCSIRYDAYVFLSPAHAEESPTNSAVAGNSEAEDVAIAALSL
jgi:hypothetical protein